jgi:hypothetical protein
MMKALHLAQASLRLFSVLLLSSALVRQPAVQAQATGGTKRPFTVSDSIRMTQFAEDSVQAGIDLASYGSLAFSPDRTKFVVVVKKGNIEKNTNQYSLLLFRMSELVPARPPIPLAVLSSSSNRPAISQVRWLADSNTILFLGENPQESTQLYSVQCNSRRLRRLTNHPTNLVAYTSSGSGDSVVYIAEERATKHPTETDLRQGIHISTQWLADVIAGQVEDGGLENHEVFLRRGKLPPRRLEVRGKLFSIHGPFVISLSPNRKYVVIQTEPESFPEDWGHYTDKGLQALVRDRSTSGALPHVRSYELVDTLSGKSTTLLNTPIPLTLSETVWSPDGNSVILSNVRLPLDVAHPVEFKERQSKVFAIELKVPSLEITKILDNDSRLLGWDPATHLLEFEPRRPDPNSTKSERKLFFYRKTAREWQQEQAPERLFQQYAVSVEEDLNISPRLVVTDLQSDGQSVVFDPNPQFENLTFGHVEQLLWHDSTGQEMAGGLYLPPGYTKGTRYPLVIQTHGFDPRKFWVDGPWSTGYAAQALANRGIAVLQVRGPDRSVLKPNVGARAMAAFEEVVHHLDAEGIIDPDRVGLMGFSRTCFHVTYALTHSNIHFATASITDGIDASYFQYMSASNAESNFADDAEELNGGVPPFGKGLSAWMSKAPGFLMYKINTPLLVQAIGPRSLVAEWEWFSGLSRLGKPVDLIYIPDGTHILEKPWSRLISQQGNVDWFCFWLKHEESSSSAISPRQYALWRKLRQLQDRSMDGASEQK